MDMENTQYMFVCLFVYLFVCLFVYLFVFVCICVRMYVTRTHINSLFLPLSLFLSLSCLVLPIQVLFVVLLISISILFWTYRLYNNCVTPCNQPSLMLQWTGVLPLLRLPQSLAVQSNLKRRKNHCLWHSTRMVLCYSPVLIPAAPGYVIVLIPAAPGHVIVVKHR